MAFCLQITLDLASRHPALPSRLLPKHFLNESFVSKITALVVRHWLLDPCACSPELLFQN